EEKTNDIKSRDEGKVELEKRVAQITHKLESTENVRAALSKDTDRYQKALSNRTQENKKLQDEIILREKSLRELTEQIQVEKRKAILGSTFKELLGDGTLKQAIKNGENGHINLEKELTDWQR